MTQIDMKPTIIAKSDQLNSDDLIGGPKTIKITSVTVTARAEQPCVINFEGDDGKPWKPSKSMCRILIHVWGDDGANYVGKNITLYRDQTVKWAGTEVGGIRISHMEGLTENKTIPLTISRGSKKPFTVRPLQIKQPPAQKIGGSPISDGDYQGWTQRMDDAQTIDDIKSIGVQIGQVSDRYDQASIDKLKAYYSDRMNTIKSAGADETFTGDM